jgi:predicted dehydrogenase
MMKALSAFLLCAGLLVAADPIRLMILDPGHFHAGLIQKEMYPDVSPRVDVYAPLGPELIAHLSRVAVFNLRPDNPTRWEVEVHAGPDCLERMLRERPGNVVVFSGRNAVKIDRLRASVEAGLNVLADKPWIIRNSDMGKLEAALETAERRRLVAYDIMTERYEVTSALMRELLSDAAVYGTTVAGTDAEPGVFMESVHYLFKSVAGVPNLRPAEFFDVQEQGEGLADLGTHLVDLVHWKLFPGQALDYRGQVRVISGARWPTRLTRAEFRRVTGEADYPPAVARSVKNGVLDYFCNNQVVYTVRGIRVKLNILWGYEAPAGTGDLYVAVFRGSRARVEIRQGKEENYRPELYVVPGEGGVAEALAQRVAALRERYPGLSVESRGARIHVAIPDRFRVGHEAHFAQVVNQYLKYLRDPASLPAWEKPNMLAKYFITTRGVEIARTLNAPPAP